MTLTSQQAMQQALENYCQGRWTGHSQEEAFKAGYLAAQPQWQPIERAPEGMDCFVWYEGEYYIAVKSPFLKDAWFNQETDTYIFPSHWMPLPQPPERNGHNG